MTGNGEGDVDYAEKILEPHLKAFPKVMKMGSESFLCNLLIYDTVSIEPLLVTQTRVKICKGEYEIKLKGAT